VPRCLTVPQLRRVWRAREIFRPTRSLAGVEQAPAWVLYRGLSFKVSITGALSQFTQSLASRCSGAGVSDHKSIFSGARDCLNFPFSVRA